MQHSQRTDEYLAICRRRAAGPIKTYDDVFCMIEAETDGRLNSRDFHSAVRKRCKELNIDLREGPERKKARRNP